jgi:beta-lactamase class A
VTQELERALRRTTMGVAADWGVYAKLLGTGEEVDLGADSRMDTMSVIKLAILVQLYRSADSGVVDLSERISFDDHHRRPGTGVLHLLDRGLQPTLRDAASLMITVSDNSATDICLRAAGGPDGVNQAMRALGLGSIEVTGSTADWFRALGAAIDPMAADLDDALLYRDGPWSAGARGADPWKGADARERFHFGSGGAFGLATARDIGRLLEMLVRGDCASAGACAAMLEMLRSQAFNTRIPRYLLGAVVAHKTGDFEPFIANDAGIVEGHGRAPVVMTILTGRHRGYWAHLEEAVARVSESIWRYSWDAQSSHSVVR